MDLNQLISLTFQFSIFATVFGFGLKVTTEDVLYVIRRQAPLARSLFAMFVVMPVVAAALAYLFGFKHAVEIALVALAISPLPSLIPKRLVKAGGEAPYALALLATVALLSVVIVPPLVALLSRIFGRPFTPSEWHVVGIIAIFALLPLAAGMAFRRLWPAQADRIEEPVLLVGGIVLRLAALALLVTSWGAIWTLIGDGTVIAIAVFIVVGLVAGHLLGGRDADGRTTLAIATASRHPAIALSIAAANSSEEGLLGASILLYLLLNAIIGVPYTLWRQKQHADAAAAAAILAAQRKAVDDVRAGRAAPYYAVPPAASASGPSPQAGGDAVKPS